MTAVVVNDKVVGIMATTAVVEASNHNWGLMVDCNEVLLVREVE